MPKSNSPCTQLRSFLYQAAIGGLCLILIRAGEETLATLRNNPDKTSYLPGQAIIIVVTITAFAYSIIAGCKAIEALTRLIGAVKKLKPLAGNRGRSSRKPIDPR